MNKYFIKNFKIFMTRISLSMPSNSLGYFIFIILLFLLCYFLAILGLNDTQKSEIYFVILGAILGIIATLIIDKIKIFIDNFNEIFNVIALCSNLFDFLREIFLEFLCHPLKDALCKHGENIIYVTPITSEKFLDETSLIAYKFFISSLNNETFLKYFDEIQTRQLIQRLKNKIDWLLSTQTAFLHLKNGIPSFITTVFIHFVSLFMLIINYDDYKWKDSQIRTSLVETLQLFIFVHCDLIIMLQRIIEKHKKLINLIER